MPIGTSATVTQEFVDVLSQELLIQPDAQYVFATMANAARERAMGLPDVRGESGAAANIEAAMGNAVGTIDRMGGPGSGTVKVVLDPTTPGKTILIDRPVYLDGTFSEASRRLTEGTAIDVSAPLSPTLEQVSLTVREYGGPFDPGNSRVAPVGISDFVKRRARHDLLLYIGGLLRVDRNRFVDRVIVDLMLSSTNVTTPGDTALGSLSEGDEPLDEATLARVKRRLLERSIPPFANGRYMLVISPQHEEDLRADDKFREITRYAVERGPLMSGYLTSYAGFDICISSKIPTAAVGAGDAVTGVQAVAFGPECIGHGIGMDAEARRYASDDFGRQDMFAWLSHECWALLNSNMVERIVTA